MSITFSALPAVAAPFSGGHGDGLDPTLALALVLGLGVLAQWMAARLRVPSILLLLLFGLGAGAGLDLLDVEGLFGALLFPIVALSVAAILLEGGLTLHFRELDQIGPSLTRLLAIGIPVTWVAASAAAHWILGWSLDLSVLLGALLVVTGPTVIQPLLSHVRPKGSVGALVKWEGIVNDPIGAILAVLVLEWVISSGTGGQALGDAAVGLGIGAVAGGIGGVLTAFAAIFALKRHWVPESLENGFVLVVGLLSFVLANQVQHEAGLLAVTLYGIILGNRRDIELDHVVEFKENLRVLLIGSLFVLLAARVELAQLTEVGWRGLGFLAALILVVRPLAVVLSAIGQKLTWQEQVFLCLMAPRGIVAAAVSSLFALRLAEAGREDADLFAPLVFVVIVGTVTVYGLLAGPLARRLGLANERNEGVLLVGAHPFARGLAAAIEGAGLPAMLIDANRDHVAAARLEGRTAHYANVRSDYVLEQLPLDGIGRLLALLPNDEVNALAAMHFQSLFGRQEVYVLPRVGQDDVADSSERMRSDAAGRVLFGPGLDYAELDDRWRWGARFKWTNITEEFGFEDFRELHGNRAVPLALADGAGRLRFWTAEKPLEPAVGDRLLSLAEEPSEEHEAPEPSVAGSGGAPA